MVLNRRGERERERERRREGRRGIEKDWGRRPLLARARPRLAAPGGLGPPAPRGLLSVQRGSLMGLREGLRRGANPDGCVRRS